MLAFRSPLSSMFAPLFGPFPGFAFAFGGLICALVGLLIVVAPSKPHAPVLCERTVETTEDLC